MKGHTARRKNSRENKSPKILGDEYLGKISRTDNMGGIKMGLTKKEKMKQLSEELKIQLARIGKEPKANDRIDISLRLEAISREIRKLSLNEECVQE